MSQFPSLPLFTDAYLADTRHLSAQEHGAYLLLLMTAWRFPDCRLPDDDAKLSKWACVDGRTWKRIKPIVMSFWTSENGTWTQKRLAQEREFVSKRAEVAKANGAHGGRPNALKNMEVDNPAGSPRVSREKAPSPSPKPIEDKPLAQQLTAAAPTNKYDKLLEALLEANGVQGFRAERHVGMVNLAPIIALLEAGLDLHRDILPAIRSKPNAAARTWGYFEPQIREFVQRRQSAASITAVPPSAVDWETRLQVFRESGTWTHAWGPRPGESGCRVPSELLRDIAA